MKNIDVYATRIEIYPYLTPDKFDPIVKKCSTSYDLNTHKRKTIGCAYIAAEKKLITMRGLDMITTANSLDSYPRYLPASRAAKLKYKYKVTSPPRNKNQIRAIRFLTCYGEYSKLTRYSQQSLNTEPSFGKTYCAIASAIERGLRTIIILHSSTVKDQWIETLLQNTTVSEDRILDVQGAEKMKSLMKEPLDKDFILVLHQTIGSYLNSEGYESTKQWFEHLECGTKIIDEAHLFFANTVQTDFCSNIEKNWYLTGTMTRSDPLEIGLFKRYFSNTPSFGQDLDKTLNVVYQFVEYDSHPDLQHQAYILTTRGPSSSKFIEYAINLDEYQTIFKVLLDTVADAKTHPGRIIIVAPKIDACERIKDLLESEYPDDMIRTMHSKHTNDENLESKKSADIIITTISKSGTGADIKGLRNMIILEPYTSEVTANQLPKRLRPMADGSDSYCYDLVDIGFEPLVNMQQKRKRFLKKCCKEISVKEYEGGM